MDAELNNNNNNKIFCCTLLLLLAKKMEQINKTKSDFCPIPVMEGGLV